MKWTVKMQKFGYHYVASYQNFKEGWYNITGDNDKIIGSAFFEKRQTQLKDFPDRGYQWFGWGKSDGEIDFVEKNFVNKDISFDMFLVSKATRFKIERNKDLQLASGDIDDLLTDAYCSVSSGFKKSYIKEALVLMEDFDKEFPNYKYFQPGNYHGDNKTYIEHWKDRIEVIRKGIEKTREDMVEISKPKKGERIKWGFYGQK